MALKRKHFILSLLILALVAGLVSAAYVTLSWRSVHSKGDNRYVAAFNDTQSKQLPAARKGAFPGAPLKNRESVQDVMEHLVEVRSCRNYLVAPLTHSVPYLTPGAKAELDSIAMDFRGKVKEKGLPRCRLVVTSLLRVSEDVDSLRKKNANAVSNSTHMYGTTFDIAWSRYQCASPKADGDEYLELLAEVLKEHRKNGRIFVKYETRQRCFHITVRK